MIRSAAASTHPRIRAAVPSTVPEAELTPGFERRAPLVWLLLACLAPGGFAASQPGATSAARAAADAPASPGQALTDIAPRRWAVDAAENEIRAIEHPGQSLRYRMHITDRKGDQIRDEIESRDGTVARTVQRDGRALTPDEDAAERARLNDLLSSPDAFAKHMEKDRSGKKTAVDLVRVMPDAMIYTYVPGQPQLPNSGSRRQVVLDYNPNPQWTPPNTTAEGLTGLRGRIWIDADSRTTVRMEGAIFRQVNFGWGMLAHIYPGGNLLLEQANPVGSRWIFTHFQENISVRALMVKTMDIRSSVEASNFQPIPEMSYADAIHLLLSAPSTVR